MDYHGGTRTEGDADAYGARARAHGGGARRGKRRKKERRYAPHGGSQPRVCPLCVVVVEFALFIQRNKGRIYDVPLWRWQNLHGANANTSVAGIRGFLASWRGVSSGSWHVLRQERLRQRFPEPHPQLQTVENRIVSSFLVPAPAVPPREPRHRHREILERYSSRSSPSPVSYHSIINVVTLIGLVDTNKTEVFSPGFCRIRFRACRALLRNFLLRFRKYFSRVVP